MDHIKKLNAHQEIDHIFHTLLPENGMVVRTAQIILCHTMLDAMAESRIALCDAGVGIGKTLAYLVAGVLFRKYNMDAGIARPILISTASIALQNAILNEYIPQLSEILTNTNIIDRPLLAVVRKGKKHYVCDERLQQRLRKANMKDKNQKNRAALLSLRGILDMDGVPHLTNFDRDLVCVPKSCDCTYKVCRYMDFMQASSSPTFVFQICNHNYFIADAIHRSEKLPKLLPDYQAAVIDEAHKLPDAARQMFSKSLSIMDMLSVVVGLRDERFILAHENLKVAFDPIATALENACGDKGPEHDECFTIARKCRPQFKRLVKTLESINKMLAGAVSSPLNAKLSNALEVCTIFRDNDKDYILYAEKNEDGDPALNAAAANYTDKMQDIIWQRRESMILTSGTLAIGDDFSRFKEDAGLEGLRRDISESTSPSPFDYQNNCLLYFPEKMAHSPYSDEARYYAEVACVLGELIRLTNGHSLVLFNAYTAMAAVYENMKQQDTSVPIFVMKRNQPNILRNFKESGNGVLLATGAAWEGMDFPGDTVSSLVIVRLPFAVPNPFTDRKKKNFPDLRSFIRKVILPEMQIKLKQGFGRAIRTETDTCVISILDERALRGKRYHNDVLAALPEMPVTQDKVCVAAFICAVKDDSYFWEKE